MMTMDDTNLALLTTPLQHWQEVAKELLKNNKNLDALRYIIAQTGFDMVEAGQIRDQLRKRIMNEAVVAKNKAPTDDIAALQAENARLRHAIETALYMLADGNGNGAYEHLRKLVDADERARKALEGGE